MLRLRIIIILLSVASTFYGQDVKDTIPKRQIAEDPCVAEQKKDTVIKQNFSEIVYLKNEIARRDSIISNLQATLNRQKNHLIFADSIILRLANDCFRFRYDQEKVNNAKLYFANMFSVQLQKQFAPLMRLLNKYGQYYKEIEGVLQRTQNDYNINQRKWKSPFKNDESPNRRYLLLLKNTRYYKESYKKDWSIYYLDELIDKAILQIEAFDKDARDIELKLTELL